MAFNDSSLSSISLTSRGYPVSGWFSDTNWSSSGPAPTLGPSSLPAPVIAAVTGVNPIETSYSLYGHTIPLSVFGVGRIGGEIISGPWIENGLASFIISFGVPADPTGTRTLREIAFDSEVVWDSSSGFSTEQFTYRFYGGTLTQSADALENTHFGVDAVAYRPQILLAFENLPLANTKFGKIPYVAAIIADSSGNDVNLGEAFERLAYSPWVGYTSSQFETIGITDGLVGGGLIIAQPTEFLNLIQQFGRFYRSWDILQTDKLRIVDRGDSVTEDVTLDKTRMMDKVRLVRDGPTSVPRELELTTIDPGADYTLVPSKASRARAPVNVSASVATESVYLPMIMESSTRQSLVAYAKYQEEVGRKKISGTAMAFGLEIEPGDLVKIDGLGEGFFNEIFKVKETLHGANYAVEFTAESFLKCNLTPDPTPPPPTTDPSFSAVVLLLGFEGAAGATGSPGMTDESLSAHGTATVLGQAQIDTAQSKYGSTSLRLDGSSDLISFPDSADWHLSTSNSDQFTVECFIRFAAITAPDNLIVGQLFSNGRNAWGLETVGTAGEFRFKSSADLSAFNTVVTSSGASIAIGVWYHFAVDKDSSGKIRLYKDGVMIGSATPADSSMGNSAEPLHIGCQPGGNGINGWIDELRITKGVARYASDSGFGVPSGAFPRS